MQQIDNALATATTASGQMVRPKVIAHWGDSRHLDNVQYHSSSDYYSRITILKHQPQIYWMCNEGTSSTIVSDASGNNHHGVVTGTATTALPLIVGDNAALSINGARFRYTDDGSVFNTNMNQNFTVEVWVKATSVNGATVVQCDNGSLKMFRIYENAGHWSAGVSSGGSEFVVTASASIATGTVYYLALSVINNVLTLYVNGVSQGTATITGTINHGNGFFFSAGTGDNATFFNGTIDEVLFHYPSAGSQSVLIQNVGSALARYLAGTVANNFGASKYLHNVTQAFNGRNYTSFPWAILGMTDINNDAVSPDCDYYYAPRQSQHLIDGDYNPILPGAGDQGGDAVIFDDTYDFGWVANTATDGSGNYSQAQLLIATFDARFVTDINVYSSPYYGTVHSFIITYWEPNGTKHVTAPQTIPNGSYSLKFSIPAGGLTLTAVEVSVSSTQNANIPAAIQEIAIEYNEDISADIVSFDIQKTKENFDSSVPIGQTSSNQISLVLQNATGKYNQDGTQTQAPFIQEDVSFDVSLGWDTNNDFLVDDYVLQGTFYADEWSNDTSSMEMTVSARDMSKRLQDNTIPQDGFIVKESTAGRGVAQLAGLGGVPYKNIQYVDSYFNTCVKDRPIGFWPFNESGMQTWVPQYKNSDSNYAFIWQPQFNKGFVGWPSQTITVEFWMQDLGSTGNHQTVLYYHWESFPNPAFTFDFAIKFRSTGEAELRVQTTNLLSGASNFADGLWHHWAFTYNASTGTGQIYKDGVQIISGALPVLASPGMIDTGILYIGAALNTSVYQNVFAAVLAGNIIENLNANISELRIWDNVQSQSQLRKNMANRIYGDETNLVACWSMEEETGRDAFNSVGYTNRLVVSKDIARINTALGQIVDYGGVANGLWDQYPTTGFIDAPAVSDEVTITTDGFSKKKIPVQSAIGTVDKAANFSNGNSARIPTNSDHDLVSAITIECWINPSVTNCTIVSKGTYQLNLVSGKVQLKNVGTGDTQTTATATVVQNAWNHIVFTSDVNTNHQACYINGISQTLTNGGTGTFSVFSTNSNPITVGGNYVGGFYGLVIYDKELTADQAAKHYMAGVNTNLRKFFAFYPTNQSFWDAMNEVATPDLGIFIISEDETLYYDTLDQFYNPAFTTNQTSQYVFTDGGPKQAVPANVVSGNPKLQLVINKVNVHLTNTNPVNLTQYSSLWDGTSGESLQNTELVQPLSAFETGALYTKPYQNNIFSNNGWLKINNEIIGYTFWTPDGKFAGLQRGLYGTIPAQHAGPVGSGKGANVGEVRVYSIAFSGAALNVQYPFVSAVTFDNRAKIELFQYTGFGATLVISDKATDHQTTILQGTNSVTGLDNFMSIAGINIEDSSSVKGQKVTNFPIRLRNHLNIRKYGKKELTLDNKYITDVNQGNQIGNYILERYNSAVPLVTLSVMCVPQLQLRDRVTISYFNQLGISSPQDYFVMQANVSYDGGLTQELLLRQVV